MLRSGGKFCSLKCIHLLNRKFTQCVAYFTGTAKSSTAPPKFAQEETTCSTRATLTTWTHQTRLQLARQSIQRIRASLSMGPDALCRGLTLYLLQADSTSNSQLQVFKQLEPRSISTYMLVHPTDRCNSLCLQVPCVSPGPRCVSFTPSNPRARVSNPHTQSSSELSELSKRV